MTKTEIEFLRAAGFSLAEIMAMEPKQNEQKVSSAAPAIPVQNAQKTGDPQTAPAQAPASAGQEPAPAGQTTPAGQPTPDQSTAMLDKLDKILAAIQSGNRSAASIPTQTPQSPEEIAGTLI